MTTLTVTIDSAAYETMITATKADFAAVEPHVSGVARRHTLKLHGRALYIQGLVDDQNGIVRAAGGEPKPPPAP